MSDEAAAPPIRELVDAACFWGWAGAPEGTLPASADRAERLLGEAPASARQDFLIACLSGDVESVGQRLDQDPSLIRRPLAPRGWAPLLYVSCSALLERPGPRSAGILEVARLLLERGADPNVYYSDPSDPQCRFPALYAAVALSKNLTLVRLLLEAGANPNDSQSVYHAAEHWDSEALELLHVHGASEKEISYCMFHKLDFAHEPGVRWFLDHGADPNGRHPAGDETPLHWAIKRTCAVSTVALLLDRGADPAAHTREGFTAYPRIHAWTPLDLAERLGRRKIAELLLERGAPRGPRTVMDDFVVACAGGDRPAARRLLEQHPDLPRQLSPEDRALPAHLAQQDGAAGVELMLELGFDADARGWGGSTPLHWAACRGNRALVRSLLARGVPWVDLGAPAGSPLHQALYHRWNPAGDYRGVLEELVAAGVDLPSELPATGDAALDAAVTRLRAKPGR